MDDVSVELEQKFEISVKDQLTKVVLSTVVGFLAGKLTELAYDKFIIERRIKLKP